MTNFKSFLATISPIISVTAFSQRTTFPVGEDVYDFNWVPFEKKVSKIEKDNFIQSTVEDFEYFRSDNFENLDSLRNHIHFIDLNDDKKLDVIFQGHNGAESQEVIIFINTAKGYTKVFSTMQGIIKMEWKNKKLSKLFINNWGCCDDYLEYHKIYDLNYNNSGLPEFKQVYQSLYVRHTFIPDTLLSAPFRFEVLNDGYKIRMEPKIDEFSLEPWAGDKPVGNSIGMLEKGAQGIALAKKWDKTGREWLYVEIDELYHPQNKILYTDREYPTKVIGWISSRFIKML